MQALIDLLLSHGLAIVFVVVLLARVGAPLPASPLLVVAGGLAAGGALSLPALFALSIGANLLGDAVWYAAGRAWGHRVLGVLCRVSLSPDSCVRQSELLITRWGASALVAAKFLPGVSVVAAPMAGAVRMSLARFVAYDSVAGGVWTAVFLGLGVIFSRQIQRALAWMTHAGHVALALLLLAVLGFVAWRWLRRRRVRAAASLPRIHAEELQALIEAGAAPVLIDVRSAAAAELDPRHLPGALRLDLADIARHAPRLPHDRELVLYCNCPNEVSAAVAAQALRGAGLVRARPLAGGLDGWAAGGRPLAQAAWRPAWDQDAPAAQAVPGLGAVGGLDVIARSLLLAAGCIVATLGSARACPPVAQLPSAAQMAAAQAQARNRGFLWRLEQGGRVSWLYGTMHVAKLDWAFPGPKVAAALKAARVVALEMDPTDLDAARAALAPFGAAGANQAAPLPKPLQQRLARRIEAECLPAATMAALAPTMQAMTLATLAVRRDGLDPAFGIDAMLAGFAHGAGRPVVALESLEQQLAALTGGQPDEERRFVERTLDELDSDRARGQALRVAQAWADGDLATLESYPRWCECLETPADRALMRRLLDDRNAWMAGRIEALHREGGGVFAAVGSMHMIGTQGLPALLAARGWRVERVAWDR